MHRTLGISAALLATAILLTGCARAEPAPTADAEPGIGASGTESRSIVVGDDSREYLLHLPDEPAPEPTLIVFAHGGFGDAAQAESAYGWDRIADREGVIVAYPQALGLAWNAGECCGKSARQGVDDVAFLSGMVSALQDEYGVDPSRTFATGMSNGAMMNYRMACETDVFAAIAPVAGTIVTGCDDPTPASVLHIHGLADERVRFDGERGSGTARVDGMPVDEVAALWRSVDGCGEPVTVDDPPLASVRADCSGGMVVELLTVEGAGHQWPGASTRGAADPDPASPAIDATETIWSFFAAADASVDPGR